MMEPKDLIEILVGLLALGGTAAAIARYFVQNQQRISLLKQQVKALEDQTNSIRTAQNIYREHGSTDVYERLLKVSSEAAKAVMAEIHSISVPVPSNEPTALRIILSTDPAARKIVGKEFPITKGIAGFVFKSGESDSRKRVMSDPRHFSTVDKAAGTHTGEGAMLTVPLKVNQRCRGVIQFMKSKGEEFNEADVATAEKWAQPIARLLIELEETPQEDIPSIARVKRQDVSILFTDIQGFSSIASRVRLETSVALLNEYYSRLLDFALTRSGKLQEYVGDGLFISFSLDRPAASARAAVLSALDMQQEFGKVLESWRQFDHPVSSNAHRIGIATGTVYAGLVGHPVERREKLVGPTVNLSAHLCDAAKGLGGGVMICPATADLIESDGFEMKNARLPSGGIAYLVSKKEA